VLLRKRAGFGSSSLLDLSSTLPFYSWVPTVLRIWNKVPKTKVFIDITKEGCFIAQLEKTVFPIAPAFLIFPFLNPSTFPIHFDPNIRQTPFQISHHPICRTSNFYSHILAAGVIVTVSVEVSVRQPVWQVGHRGGPVTVTVGVIGHLLLVGGTSNVVTVKRTQSGCGGHVAGIKGQLTANR
jgi:hypothetical protein